MVPVNQSKKKRKEIDVFQLGRPTKVQWSKEGPASGQLIKVFESHDLLQMEEKCYFPK